MNVWGMLQAALADGPSYYTTMTTAVREQGLNEAANQLRVAPKELQRALWVWQQYSTRELQAAARRHKASVRAMEVLASAANKLGRRHPQRIPTLLALLEQCAEMTVTQAAEHAKQSVAELLKQEGSRGRRQQTFAVQAAPDMFNQRRANLLLSDATMAALEQRLAPAIAELRKATPELSHAQAGAQALVNAVLNGDATQAPQQVATPMFMLALQGPYTYREGLITDRGARVPWEDAVNYELQRHGYVLVIAKDEAGVPQATRHRVRFADDAQRDIAVLETLRCTWDGCTRAARDSQIHHIESYAAGGTTTQENLAALCAKHNGQNDDDPSKPRNGRIERDPDTGRLGRRPVDGSHLRVNDHPDVKFGWREFALDQYD